MSILFDTSFKEVDYSRACPVRVKENMLIRQVRSFGSLRKESVCMPCTEPSGKPNVSFRAPTYFIGGSNFSLHGRVGLEYFGRFMMYIPFGRILHKWFLIQKIVKKIL